ncbi:spectinomycin phosphotransferase [Lentzea fradiae]|uniref:Spectinomycin phosphotransferase n=1 Tax=Lentzea fradiae TaxID=200378 RepID=A0A1G8CLR7_9PSEU|nr:spectinomycin phosphotransferase [Lentzea fradiae]
MSATHRPLSRSQAPDTSATGLTYAAIGFGDHHRHVTALDGTRWFATVADLTGKPHCGPTASTALTGLRSAMLRAAGLEFVVAPVGEPVVQLGERYALSVLPAVEGSSVRTR